MKQLLAAFAVTLLAATAVHAADKPAAKPLTAQQQRMKDCNAKAKADALKGDARKAFMKKCLSKAGHAAAMASKPKP